MKYTNIGGFIVMGKRIWISSVLIIFLAVLCTACGLPKKSESNIEIIAHRGFAGQYPENTIYGAQQTLKLSVPAEFDVQFTIDGVMVVIHDDTVDRTTNGTGTVSQLEYSYIKTLDAGKKFSAEYTGQVVPKFEDYLKTLKNAKYIYPEIKKYRSTKDIITFTKTLIDYGFEDKATIQSFNYAEVLPYIRQVSKKIKVAALCSNQSMFDSYLSIAKKDGNSLMSISTSIADIKNLETCKNNNLDISVWTVNDESVLRELIDIGYKKIISNKFFNTNK